MKIFLAGAAGAVGTALVPLLRERGHEVVGTTRSQRKAAAVTELGATAMVLDVLDAEAVRAAVARVAPDVIVHEATALSGMGNLRKFDQDFAVTNQLRTVGTDNLLAAAEIAGVRRLVAQSFTGWPNARTGAAVKTEDDPLDTDPPKPVRRSLAAIKRLESTVTAAPVEGVVLRYGGFYGAGTSLGEGGEHIAMVRQRKFPIVGSGAGVWSLVHIEDVATATALAIEASVIGVFNVVDDDPAPVREWLPYLATTIGAPAPRHVPTWLARPMIGAQGVTMMTASRGSSNRKAREVLGWKPQYPSWRTGFRDGLGVPARIH